MPLWVSVAIRCRPRGVTLPLRHPSRGSLRGCSLDPCRLGFVDIVKQPSNLQIPIQQLPHQLRCIPQQKYRFHSPSRRRRILVPQTWDCLWHQCKGGPSSSRLMVRILGRRGLVVTHYSTGRLYPLRLISPLNALLGFPSGGIPYQLCRYTPGDGV